MPEWTCKNMKGPDCLGQYKQEQRFCNSYCKVRAECQGIFNRKHSPVIDKVAIEK
jgi:hypothetical protein